METERRTFGFDCDPELPRILRRLGRALVLSTYRSGRVLLLRPGGEDGVLEQRGIDLPRPMGIAVDGSRLAVATREDLVVLDVERAFGDPASTASPAGLASAIESSIPTGPVDLHDVAWDDDQLWAVNTRCSSIDRLCDGRVEVAWQPPFVSELVAEDRCHLNGLALEDGEPRWATALGATDEAGAWRRDRSGGGVLLHLPTGETVLEGLGMPHSPRVWDRQLYFLVAARGEVCRADPVRRTWEIVARVPGFARGLARAGDYLFVGHSLVRRQHLFSDLPVAREEQHAGVTVIDSQSGEIVAGLRYRRDCEEIYDVQLVDVSGADGAVSPPAPRPRSGSDGRSYGAAGESP